MQNAEYLKLVIFVILVILAQRASLVGERSICGEAVL